MSIYQSVLDVPFPGRGANFICFQSDWWKVFQSNGTSLMREVQYISSTQDSFFTGFKILGYQDRSIALSVTCRLTDIIKAGDYFEKLGLPFYGSFVFTQAVEERRKLFLMLRVFNTFSETDIKLIDALAVAQTWDQVTFSG